MKCQDFELRVRELVNPQDCGSPDPVLSEHAQQCKACSRRLEEERHLETQLSRLSDAFQGLVPEDGLQGQIRRVIQTETRTRLLPEPDVERTDRALHWLLAAAAIVLAVAAGGVYTITSDQEPARTASFEEGREVSNSPSLPAGPRAVRATPEQMYSEFIPIGNCRSLDCLDRARMMRIDLPRSSVSYFGIPRTRIQSRGDRIVADVLVGEDGIARAIRFVY